jgi:hypothetical protein
MYKPHFTTVRVIEWGLTLSAKWYRRKTTDYPIGSRTFYYTACRRRRRPLMAARHAAK